MRDESQNFLKTGEIHMNIKMHNIGKIIEANIKTDGISVIAGYNNTGKSTILKTMYLALNIFRNSNDKIKDERTRSLRLMIVRKEPYFDKEGYDFLPTNLLDEFSESIIENLFLLKEKDKYPIFKEIFHECLVPYHAYIDEAGNKHIFSDEFLKPIFENVREVLERSKEDYNKYIGEMYIRNTFYNQINSLLDNSSSDIELVSFDKTNYIKIMENKIQDMSFDSINEPDAIYLPAANILDMLNRTLVSRTRLYSPESDIGRLLREEIDGNLTFESYSEIEENTIKIKEILDEVIQGRLEHANPGTISFKETNVDKPINMGNVASGLKTFLIIQKLVENGHLKKNSVLLIDEPETNLHPEWHLKFAEILVLMYKYMGVVTVVNSHSPYFIRALEVKMADHGVKNAAHFYLMKEKENNRYIAEDVTEHTNKIYEKLYMPLEYL